MASFERDTFRIAASKGLMVVLGLLTSAIIARWLGPNASGVLASVLVIPSLMVSVGSLGVRQATGFLVAGGEYGIETIKQSMTQLWLVSSTVCVCLSLLATFQLSDLNGDSWLIVLACLPIPFRLFISYNTGLFLGQNKIREFARINWVPKLLVLILTVVLVVLLSLGLYGALLATTAGSLVMSVVFASKGKFVEHFTLNFNWKLIKAMCGLGMIYALAVLMLQLNYKIDIILLNKLASSYDVGIYSKGASLMEYLWQIPMLFSAVTFARSAAAKNKADFSRKVTQLLRISLVLVCVAAAVLAIFATLIILTLFGREFQASATVLRVLLPGVVLLTVLKVVNMDLAGRGKPWICIWAMLPALAVNVILNFVLIPPYGANGAALASTVSYFLGGVLTWLVYAKETGQQFRGILMFSSADFYMIYARLVKR